MWHALSQHQNGLAADAIKLLLLTGARRSEVLGMRWDEIDLEARIWIKPPSRTKQKRMHRVPLSGSVMELLAQLRDGAKGEEFVFPGTGSSGHLADIKRSWASVCAEAGIVNCRLNDLRHSFASLIVSNGGSLETIGGLLGHSQTQTTKRYAHLFDATLRDAAELVAKATL